MTCCVVYFSLTRLVLTDAPRGPGQWLLWSGLSAYTGICWATALTILWRAIRAGGTPVEPGQWLLFCVGMVLALDIVVRWSPDALRIPRPAIMAAGSCSVLLIPVLSRHLPLAWKRFFMLLVLIYALPVAVIMLDNLDAWPLSAIGPGQLLDFWRRFRRMIVLLAAFWVLICDYRAARHGSWLHYFGIVSTTIIWLRT
jgi:hypothetical protein